MSSSSLLNRRIPSPNQHRHRSSTPSTSFRVVIRVRPSTENSPAAGRNIVQVTDHRYVTIYEYHDWAVGEPPLYKHRFIFDEVFDEDASQEVVYHGTADHAVKSVLEGYNACVIAYGQTGTGKTYSMEGEFQHDFHHDRGIIPRAVADIFTMTDALHNSNILIRASYLQIYNESVSDLLAPDAMSLPVREDKSRGVFVEGLSSWKVESPEQIFDLIRRGSQSRATAATRTNAISSRSHAVFTITVERPGLEQGQIIVGKLNLVDLAGSERIGVSGSTGQRLQESKKINQSLSSLGNVISALTGSRYRHHIPYRNSKLTRLLEDSLGGNCRTTMIACISSSPESFSESLSTLQFANRAKNIKNNAHINEDMSSLAPEVLIQRYERELQKLREAVSLGQADRSLLAEVKEKRNAAEKDHKPGLDSVEQMGNRRLFDQKLEEVPNGSGEAEKKRLQEKALTAMIDQKLRKYQELLGKQRDMMMQLSTRLHDKDAEISDLRLQLQRSPGDPVDLERANFSESDKPAMSESGTSSVHTDEQNQILRKRISELELKIKQMEMVKELSQPSPSGPSDSELRLIKLRLNHHVKERNALRVILETKVAYLIDRIESGIDEDKAQIGSRTRREIQILKRLVHASVQAIEHSDEMNGLRELA